MSLGGGILGGGILGGDLAGSPGAVLNFGFTVTAGGVSGGGATLDFGVAVTASGTAHINGGATLTFGVTVTAAGASSSGGATLTFGLAATATGFIPGTVATISDRTPYRLRIVDAAGRAYANITDFRLDRAIWELNNWGTLEAHIPTTLPAAADCIPGQRELQLWYQPPPVAAPPRCIWWGPIINRTAQQDGTTQIQAAGILWYLSRIQMGPVLTNYILDPNFEDASLAHYTATGATMTSATNIVRAGSRSMKLVSSTGGQDNYASQTVTFDNSAGVEGLAVFFRSRFYLEATTTVPYVNPAFMERGLYMRRIESGVTQSEVWTPWTNSAPRNQWVHMFAPATFVPKGHSQQIEFRWYSPGGTIYWDTAMAAVEESTGANTANTYADLNSIISNVLAYAQDTTKNKPNLHINGPSGTFGVTLSRQWQFFDHGFVWDAALKPLIDAGVCDLDVTWDAAATTRTVTTYTQRGNPKPWLALTLGGNATVYTHAQDAQQTAGAITVLPQGMQSEQTIGSEQKAALGVGYAADTSANGGIVFDETVSATPEATLDAITAQATTELARRKNLATNPAWSVPADIVLAGGLEVGDTIPFEGSYGWISESSKRRVATMQLVPEQSNTMVVTGTTLTY